MHPEAALIAPIANTPGSPHVQRTHLEERIRRWFSLLERFGLNCYGCCEPVDPRWHVVKGHSRLRRVSCSPWADYERMAEALGDRYIFSMKPNPAMLATPTINIDAMRARLRRDLAITRGCHMEIIMKDNHTIGRRPENVVEWCRLVREEVGIRE